MPLKILVAQSLPLDPMAITCPHHNVEWFIIQWKTTQRNNICKNKPNRNYFEWPKRLECIETTKKVEMHQRSSRYILELNKIQEGTCGRSVHNSKSNELTISISFLANLHQCHLCLLFDIASSFSTFYLVQNTLLSVPQCFLGVLCLGCHGWLNSPLIVVWLESSWKPIVGCSSCSLGIANTQM